MEHYYLKPRMMNYLKNLFILLFIIITPCVKAASMMDGFIDPSDGMFDVSDWLAEKKGVFPVPIIITEPAVGYGAGAALVFLHDPLAGRVPDGETFDPQSKDARSKLIPPSISAVFGAYTKNDTWFAGGAHMGVWKNDNIRYTGALVTGSINMKFYRNILAQDISVDVSIKPDVLYQGLKFRLDDSGFFAGVNYLLMVTSTTIKPFVNNPVVDFKGNRRDAAVILTLDYDNRDTIFTPNSGFNSSLGVSLFRKAVGGDTNFEKYKIKVIYFMPLAKTFVLGLRGNVETVGGDRKDIPFYQYPFVDLRGIPVMRYQGRTVAVAETELRWNFTNRWSIVGFGGVGRTKGVKADNPVDTVYSKGMGMRYFIARRFGAHVGFDIAKGPEDTAFYLQFGHAWR